MATLDEIQARETRHVLQTYRRFPVTFVRGEGVRLFDADGREYLDLLSGIGVASLGHAHPGLADAIADQARTLIHTSNLFYHPLQGELAERLAALSGLPRAFFCNSGTEAVEACLKFARRYWYTRGEPRPEFIALEESFHGRTFGSLSVTSDEHYRAPFAPLLAGVRFVPANDPAALLAAVSTSTAAIIAEPVQGEGGIRPLTPAFAAAINEACAKTGALLHRRRSAERPRPHGPSVLLLDARSEARSSSPSARRSAAACRSARRSSANRWPRRSAYGDHGTTYGGNLLACRAGLVRHARARRRRADRPDRPRRPPRRAASAGDRRGAPDREGGARRRPHVGAGAPRATRRPVVPAGLARGVVVNRTAETVVRLLPPLVITEAEVDEALGRLDAALGAVEAQS